MTYPPQGPYGQQPDPYGQQPQPDPYGQQQPPQYGGGYPQQAGYQQQPTGQYGYDPNAQYGAGYQQYGGMGGPQPPKSKGPIIAIVAIAVLLLGGLGITGFVAPGFFLSDDKNNADNNKGGGASTSADDKGSGADDFIQQLVTAADGKDKSELKELACSDASSGVSGATNSIDEITSAELKDTKEVSDEEVTAILTIIVEGDEDDYAATVVKDGGDWCWKDIVQGTDPDSDSGSVDVPTASAEPVEPPVSGAPTGDTDGEKFVQSFLDKLNAGDGAGAAAMSCSDSTSQADITEAATQSPQLQMDPAGTTADSSYVGADLKGTLGGADATGRTSAFLEDGKWCIYTFFAS